MSRLPKQFLKWSAHAVDRMRQPSRGVVVLIYHRVGARSRLDVDLPLAVFEAQMQALAESGRVRSIDEALDKLEAPRPPDYDPIVVTFDDGTADFAELAVPVLERWNIPATIYVATDFVDREREFPNGGQPISWNTLADVQRTGLLTIGSHTHTHSLLDRLPAIEIDAELDQADNLITEHLGIQPRHFAYPKAVAGSSSADRAVRARYRSAAVAGTRVNRYGQTDFFRLCRSPIQVSDGMKYFAAKVAGGMCARRRQNW